MADPASSTVAPEKPRRPQRRSVFLLLLLVFLSSPLLLWWGRPDQPVRILVLDKTVPHADYREHDSLFWALNHLKTRPPAAVRPWISKRDYVGYYPERIGDDGQAETKNLAEKDLEAVDLLFITDTYGVYSADLEDAEKDEYSTDYSLKIFGGLTDAEAMAIESFVERGGSLVAEFNTLASPTAGRPRERLEKILKIRWSGWIGRYFSDLANTREIPRWARKIYRNQENVDWAFQGPGWIFVEEAGRILVLEEGRDVDADALHLVLTTPDDPLLKNVSGGLPYYYWFDVLEAKEGAQVLAKYSFILAHQGKEKWKAFGLPDELPAMVCASRSPLKLYLAGDFSDNPFSRGPYWVAGLPTWSRMVSSGREVNDQRPFFWKVFLPLTENILQQVSPRGP